MSSDATETDFQPNEKNRLILVSLSLLAQAVLTRGWRLRLSSRFWKIEIVRGRLAHFLSLQGACIWNDLPSHITSSPCLLKFKQRLKCTYSVCLTLTFHLLKRDAVTIERDRPKFSSSRSQWITERNTTSALLIVCLKKLTFAFSSIRFFGAFCG